MEGAFASSLPKTNALSLSKPLYIAPENDACASFTGEVLDSLLFENRCVFFSATALMFHPGS